MRPSGLQGGLGGGGDDQQRPVMAGRAHHLHASPVWDELSPLSKEGGIALVKESGTYIARDMLKMPPESNDERWNESQWAEFSTVLEVVRAVPAPGPNQ